jgi:hypothetical protein
MADFKVVFFYLTGGTEKGLRLARWRAEIRTHGLQNKNVWTQRFESSHKGRRGYLRTSSVGICRL